jgi:hypothetical protein
MRLVALLLFFAVALGQKFTCNIGGCYQTNASGFNTGICTDPGLSCWDSATYNSYQTTVSSYITGLENRGASTECVTLATTFYCLVFVPTCTFSAALDGEALPLCFSVCSDMFNECQLALNVPATSSDEFCTAFIGPVNSAGVIATSNTQPPDCAIGESSGTALLAGILALVF